MRKSILIIDDDGGICSGLQEILSDDYDIVLAQSFEEAAGIVFSSGKSIDLIITDIILPGINGLEFLKILREANHAIPAIVMTGNFIYDLGRDEVSLSPCSFISKPFDIVLLLTKIKETLMTSW